MAAAVLALIALSGAVSAETPPVDDRGVLQPLHDDYARRLAAGSTDAPSMAIAWRRLRHVDAMVELVARIPEQQRPRRILYLAAGTHLAPLALCELLPADDPCSLTLTDADPAVREGVATALGELAAAGAVVGLVIEGNQCRFSIAGHPVSLTIQPVHAGPVPDIEPRWLRQADLVITHDWSGDPLEILRVVFELLRAARDGGIEDPPLLMVENLERHPYPIDLGLFSPVVRSSSVYGHRGRLPGSDGHDGDERGPPLFGGAVLLGFSDRWWREVSPETLSAVFDVLLFNEFLFDRQNVLEGGDDPLLAPALLDWWTGFGARTVVGDDLRGRFDEFLAVPPAAARAIPAMGPENRRRLACRLQLLRSLVHARADGADFHDLMPAARYPRRPLPGDYPNREMEAAYRDALRHAAKFRADMETARAESARMAATLDSDDMNNALAPCPVARPSPNEDPAAWWAAVYRALAVGLSP